MSEEMVRWLEQTAVEVSGPRLAGGPRVRGGPLLDAAISTGREASAGDSDLPRPAPTERKASRVSAGTASPEGGVSKSGRPAGYRPAQPALREEGQGCRQAEPAPVSDEASAAAQLVALGLKKSYRKGQVSIPVLRGVNLSVRRGEFLAVVGKSGSGKSTLLHLLATLDAPDKGEIYFDGQRIDNLRGSFRDALRNRYIGMIFQFYHLLPELTTLENVLAPLMIGQSTWGYLRHRRGHRKAATKLLEMVGLGHRLAHKPRELSGGEMQRAAIARALVAQPEILLADEPTGNLDFGSGREILDLLRSLNLRRNLTIVMVTHDRSIAQEADRAVCLVDGQVEDAEDI